MSRIPKPWWWKTRRAWFVQIDGRRHNLGPDRTRRCSSGIWIGQSGGNTVCHNEIAGPLMWGISVGWNWSYFPLNRARDNLIEQNHVHDVGTGILGATPASMPRTPRPAP